MWPPPQLGCCAHVATLHVLMLPSSGSTVAAGPPREYMLQAGNRADNNNGGAFPAYYFGA